VGRLRPDTIAPTTGTTAIPSCFFAWRFRANWLRTSSRERDQSWSTGTAISSSYAIRVMRPAARSCAALVNRASSTSPAAPASRATAASQDRSADARYVESCSRSCSSMWSSEKRVRAVLYSRIRRFSTPMPRRVRNSP